MSVPRSRILALQKVQCRVFNTVFNPDGVRMGTKILRQRLKGPSVAAYYPRRIGTFQEVEKMYPEYEGFDESEYDRVLHVEALKARGKGAPKKQKGPPDYKKKK